MNSRSQRLTLDTIREILINEFPKGATSFDIQMYLLNKNSERPNAYSIRDSEKISRHLRNLYQARKALRFQRSSGKTLYIAIPDQTPQQSL